VDIYSLDPEFILIVIKLRTKTKINNKKIKE